MSYLVNPYRFGVVDDGIPTENIIMYYRFDGSIVDQTGNNSLVNSGVSFGNGIYSGLPNNAGLYDNAGDMIIVDDDDILSFGDGTTDSPFSVTFAANFDSFNGFTTFLHKRGYINSSLNKEYSVFATGNENLSLMLFDQSSGGRIRRDGNTTLSTGTDYHITFTYDGSSSSTGLKIYIDAVEESSYTDGSSGSYTAMENLGEDLIVGRFGNESSGTVDGRLDYFALWDKELTQAEITAIYNKNSLGNELL